MQESQQLQMRQQTSGMSKYRVSAQMNGGSVVFGVQPDDDNGKKDFKDGHIWFAKGSGGHNIQFNLDDSTGLQLSFDSSNPIDVEEGVNCPDVTGITGTQISLNGNSTGQVLTLHDENSGDPVTIGYRLHFNSKDGAKYPFDPIIKNDGG
jgi:hypothetical protein